MHYGLLTFRPILPLWMSEFSYVALRYLFYRIALIYLITGLADGRTWDFGQAPVAGVSSRLVLTYSFTGLSVEPSFSLLWGKDFQVGSPSCSVGATTNCSVTVGFSPVRPGLRQDLLTVSDQSAHVLAQTSLVGIGLAPLIAGYPGVISTAAGDGIWGYQDSPNPLMSMFRLPQGVALDGAGNVYIADSGNAAIRKMSLSTGAVTTVAGNGIDGYSGDGGLATSANLSVPTGVVVDGGGNLYIADQGNNRIRRVDAATQVITTVAGGGTTPTGADQLGDGGPATAAILFGPQSVAVDGNGNLYIADSFNNLVRFVDSSTGVINAWAGGGTFAGSDGFGDGGPATGAQLSDPTGIALDSGGNLYVADAGNNLIRRIDKTSGIITAVAGNGNAGYSGDGGQATAATLASPQGVFIDAAGNLYVADFANNAIRQVSASTQVISTIAGTRSGGYAGDGGNPMNALLANPADVVVDDNGNLYIADYSNNVMRKVSFAPLPMAFPSEPVGSASATQSVDAFNIGNEALTLNSVSLTANFGQTSSGATNCSGGIVLSPGSGCVVAVSFEPTTTGGISGSLTVTTNSLNNVNNQLMVGLSGTGLAGSAAALSLNPSSLSFSAQVIGTTSTAQVVNLSNSGGSSLSISAISMSGAQASDFQLSSTCGTSLAAGASCTVSVNFTPTAAGTRSATLLIADSATNSPQSLAVSGTAVTPPAALSLNPSSLSFSAQVIGTTSTAQVVNLSNSGGSSLSISAISMSGAQAGDFPLSSTCGTSLAAGASCTVSVRFTPTAAGTRSATLLIADSAANSPQSLAVSGTAVTPPAALSLNPSSLSFSAQVIGSTSTAQVVNLSNSGGSAARIKTISLEGPDAQDFQISTTCRATLAAKASCHISVIFIPKVANKRTATLVVTDAVTGLNESLSLTGIGIAKECKYCLPLLPSLGHLSTNGSDSL